ncbi:MAG: 4,5-DOPA dioxygenase extradiol [Bacteroidia bacterium]|nr:4,5-DOPA dioxygenase extradiol [Bacteroidia bacterium]MCO5252997.1 4,5-DOPA dioxygenase extradiol [Bacteroidota bacterium]
MDRKKFLKTLVLAPFAYQAMKMNALNQLNFSLEDSVKMPVLFVGHGNPMNAIEENEFVEGFRNVSKQIPKPQAIICVSAHWETRGTFVTAMEHPKTIHDFGGFPKELYEVEYPVLGNPELAKQTQALLSKSEIGLNQDWGLDHGAWTVLKHLYPNADVPVVELSIDYTKDARYHFELAQELSSLRKKGVLIIGSGNIVHNLRLVAWNKINENYGFDWALEANDIVRKSVLNRDFAKIINYKSLGKAFELAVPTPEHYLPLLYALALAEPNEEISIFNDAALAGSLTMTSYKIG